MKRKIIIPFRRKSDFCFSAFDLFFKVNIRTCCLEIFISDHDDLDTKEEFSNELV